MVGTDPLAFSAPRVHVRVRVRVSVRVRVRVRDLGHA